MTAEGLWAVGGAPTRIIRQHMPLQAGTRLGPYEVIALIGAGGMGEVWLATELRLGRKVALKLLPADLTRDPVRIQRFEQEARAASALNHPNVCTIYALDRNERGPALHRDGVRRGGDPPATARHVAALRA